MPKYEYVSYTQFEKLMKVLTIFIQARVKECDFIYAPPRGGWPVAVHLSHSLQVKPIITPHDISMGKIPYPLKHPEQNHILFVDDIVDSGKTLTWFNQTIRRVSANGWNISVVTCSLFYKPRASVRPDICLRTVSDDTWVVFPWERREDAEAERSEYVDRQEID